jgi:hypothetical protein
MLSHSTPLGLNVLQSEEAQSVFLEKLLILFFKSATGAVTESKLWSFVVIIISKL